MKDFIQDEGKKQIYGYITTISAPDLIALNTNCGATSHFFADDCIIQQGEHLIKAQIISIYADNSMQIHIITVGDIKKLHQGMCSVIQYIKEAKE